MASRYEPNRWEIFDPNIPVEQQVHSFITKRKLEHMEEGIVNANVALEVGEVKMGNNYGVFIVEDLENKTRKLNITFPPAGQGEKGADGKSAYQTWLDQGNTGTELEFLDYLKGKDGIDGRDGRDGNDGEPGPSGESAYQIWLNDGNTGTLQDFLNSLKGRDGIDGIDGINGTDGKSAYQTWLDQGNTGTESEFIESLKGKDGIDGIDGINGTDGKNGTDGEDGKSAYEIWKSVPGNENKTITEFLESLKGEPGDAVDFVEF